MLFIAIIHILAFRLPYLYEFLSLGSVYLGAFIPIVGPVYRGSANYKRLKSASDNLLLIHHNGSTYSVLKE